MSLAVRIIPTLLHRGATLVKGKQFDSWRSVGNVHQAARIYASRGVDELCILDIGATPEGRGPDFGLVENLTDGNFCPVTVGGGVRTVDDARLLLRAGADKIAIGVGAVHGEIKDVVSSDAGGRAIRMISNAFGRQAVVAIINYGIYEVQRQVHGTKYERGLARKHVIARAKSVESLGSGEILLTSIDREGMMEGYDLEMIAAVSKAVSIPVIAHGGCGTPQHMLEAIQAGASAVAAGSMFQFTDVTPRVAAEYLRDHGVEVRV